eukprot:652226-Pyramimonas_sp.AAC.1
MAAVTATAMAAATAIATATATTARTTATTTTSSSQKFSGASGHSRRYGWTRLQQLARVDPRR